jgi:hypothetical protein
MLRSTFLLALLSLQGVFANSGEENRVVVVSGTDSSRRDALPGYDSGHAQKRQAMEEEEEEDDDDAAKRFSMPEVQTMADLNIENMEGIEMVELPRLETVEGNLTITRNADLKNLTLPALRRVGGNLVLDGRFDAIDLPALSEVGGTVSIATYGSDFNCTAFRDDLANVVDVGGDFICQGDGNDEEEEEEEDENDGDDGNDDGDSAGEDDNDDNGDGEDTSGAAGSPRLGWLTLLAVPTLLLPML